MEEPNYVHRPDTEPVPGYRLLHPLGRGGFGEVWKCEAPGGLLKAIKFVHGGHHLLDDDAPADEERRAVERVKSIRHPFMLTLDRVESVGGELVIVMELADKSLADVLEARRKAGHQGLPRESLLAYLREAAELLDVMNARHGLQHLDIKPRNLFLVYNHVKVGDFGLVTSLSAAGGRGVGAITPLYASPEVFQGSISAHSDQYSLAVVYQELLTGTLPFQGKNSRQLLMAHSKGEPDLAALPEADRPAVARALSKNPLDRFPSCSDFVHALASGQTEVVTSAAELVTDETPFSGHGEETRRVRTVKNTIRARTGPVCEGSGPWKALELVSRTPLGEVWKGGGGDGSARVVKVLFGGPEPGDAGVARLGQLRHPCLLPTEVVQHAPGRLVLSSPQADCTLRDALEAYKGQGRPGVPRAKLLGWLRAAAEGLLYLNHQYGLQHLGLNPGSLVLSGDRLLLADFGLAQLVWRPAGQSLARLNGRYSAPELTRDLIGPAADQYSLALVYHELLTGSPPPRQGDGFALDALPESDRTLVALALHPDPAKRWESALEWVAALERAGAAEPASGTGSGIRVRVPASPPRPEPEGDGMWARFGTSLTADLIHERVEGFRQQWSARVVSAAPGEIALEMSMPRSLWQRWTGQRPALHIRLGLGAPDPAAPARGRVRTEVRVDLSPRECSGDHAADLMKLVGPLLVESLRTHLQVPENGRQEERLPWHFPLQVCSLQDDGQPGPPVDCQGKDISLNGIGFYLPGQLPSSRVLLRLPRTPQTPRAAMPARIVRVQSCGDGWYEVGALLDPPGEVPPGKGADAA
jgi:serine/threonine protein kinase